MDWAQAMHRPMAVAQGLGGVNGKPEEGAGTAGSYLHPRQFHEAVGATDQADGKWESTGIDDDERVS